MPAAPPAWLDATDYAPSPRPTDLLEFFGIPPSLAEDLHDNIRKKRPHCDRPTGALRRSLLDADRPAGAGGPARRGTQHGRRSHGGTGQRLAGVLPEAAAAGLRQGALRAAPAPLRWAR